MNELYRTMVQIVESETLVRAADVLHLTQPTVTRHVQQLERQLGMNVFDRIGKRLVLNHAGEVVYRYAKSLLSIEQKMADELSALGDPEVGTVYLGAGLTPSIYLLPPLLAWYRRRHPRVQFQVKSGSSDEVWANLQQREVDIGIVTTVDALWTDVHAVPLMRDPLLLVAPPGHPLVRQQTVNFVEVSKYPFVLMREGSGLRRMILDMALRLEVDIHVAMETDSLESLNRLVQNGVGLSFLPQSSVADDLGTERLIELCVADVELGSRTIMMVTRRGGQISACASQFREESVAFLNGSVVDEDTEAGRIVDIAGH